MERPSEGSTPRVWLTITAESVLHKMSFNDEPNALMSDGN